MDEAPSLYGFAGSVTGYDWKRAELSIAGLLQFLEAA